MDADLCPCGNPANLHLRGLPVCQECYDDALTCCGAIMPVEGAVVVRRGEEVWRVLQEDWTLPE